MPTSTRKTANLPKARRALAGKGLAALIIGVLLLTVIPNLMRAHLGPTIG